MSLNIDMMEIRAIDRMARGEKTLEAALLYARMGLRVMPLLPNTKMPALKSWSDASFDPAIIRGWFGPDGPHRNGNIALLIQGFKVIDIDRHGDVDGFETLNGALDDVACPKAKTPNDGMHIITTKTDVTNAPGVEILGEGKLFTVFPSVVNGKQYMWSTGGIPCPVNRIRLVEDTPTPTTAVPLAPAGYVQTVLEHIDPDIEYSEWLKVGMAIHQNDAGQAGLDLWIKWSAQGAKFKDGECERRWLTFDTNRGKPTTLRWLIVQAIKNGKAPTREDILYHGNLFSSVEIEKVNEKYGLHDMNGEMVIVYKEHGQTHFANPANFKLKLADQKIEADGKLKPLADVWLEHPDRRIITEVGMWEVGKEPEGAFNMYEGFAVQPVECGAGDIDLFLDFCLHDICRGNEKHFTFLMDLLAKKIQNPMALMRIALVMRGGEGVGKGALTRVMENIIGPKHSANVSNARSWLGDYSGTVLKSAIWLSANEAYWSGNPQQSERLKALVTEEVIDMEEKFINTRKQRNRLFIAITSNNRWAVPAGHDSRRYFMLDVSDNRKDDPDFWDEFHARMGANPNTYELNDPEYLGKVLWWFQNREITSNLQRAMETNWLTTQRRESMVESREDAFIMWARASFVHNDQISDVVTGAGGVSFPVLNRADGTPVIRVDKAFEDYRAYVNRNHKRPRMVMTISSFIEDMGKLGFEARKVVKDRLTMGGRPLPDATGAGSKISVMRLPSPYQIEDAIEAKFPLFSADIIEDES